ncbi:MAG: hypothetical protein DRJ18_03185 [Candidatus Methanomethylicota archaeon]|nr:MAG: hypothetical protein DRJ18_03185 [Candidatus Verstraetearchaeota archaeon]
MDKDIKLFIFTVLTLMTVTWVIGYFLVKSFGDLLFLILGIISMFYPLVSALIANKMMTHRSLEELNVKPKIVFVLTPLLLSFIYPYLVIYVGALISSPFVPVDWLASWVISEIRQALRESTGIEFPVSTIVLMLIITHISATLINSFPAYGEEAGWRGFLWTRLRESYSLEKALIILGVVWGVWHWPIYSVLYILMEVPLYMQITLMLEFVAFTTGISVFLVWLVEKTHSVVYPTLAHGAINAGLSFGSYVVLVEDPRIGFVSGLIPIVAIWIIAIFCYISLRRSHREKNHNSFLKINKESNSV